MTHDPNTEYGIRIQNTKPGAKPYWCLGESGSPSRASTVWHGFRILYSYSVFCIGMREEPGPNCTGSTPIHNTEYEYRIRNLCQTVLGERGRLNTEYRIRIHDTKPVPNRTGAGELVRERRVDPTQNTEYEYTIRNPCQTVLGEKGRLNTEYRIRIQNTKPVPNCTGIEGSSQYRIQNTNTEYETRAKTDCERESSRPNTEYGIRVHDTNPCQTVLGERGQLNTEYGIRVHDTKPVPNCTGREGGGEVERV